MKAFRRDKRGEGDGHSKREYRGKRCSVEAREAKKAGGTTLKGVKGEI